MNLFRSKNGNSTNHKFNQRALVIIPLVLACAALSPTAHAVVLAPDGGYPGANTAEGDGALNSLTPQARGSGANNTALGYHTLFSNTSGSRNTATGSVALANNNGNSNTASGYQALSSNILGSGNTAIGSKALSSNVGFGFPSAVWNTAVGVEALSHNVNGSSNTAVGMRALFSNIGGPFIGGLGNTAVGIEALNSNTDGSNNIALGDAAGSNLTTGDNNIDIGNLGVAGESHKIRIGTEGTHKATFIAGVWGTPIVGGAPVVVNGNGQLGVAAVASSLPSSRSTRRPKQEILRYEAMNTKLRSDFLKEHRKNEEQEKAIAQQQTEIEALKAELKEQKVLIQKVSAQLELSTSAPRVTEND